MRRSVQLDSQEKKLSGRRLGLTRAAGPWMMLNSSELFR